MSRFETVSQADFDGATRRDALKPIMPWSERLLTNDLGGMAVTPLGGIAGGMVFFLAPVVSPDARSPPPSIIDDLGNILAEGVVFGGVSFTPPVAMKCQKALCPIACR